MLYTIPLDVVWYICNIRMLNTSPFRSSYHEFSCFQMKLWKKNKFVVKNISITSSMTSA